MTDLRLSRALVAMAFAPKAISASGLVTIAIDGSPATGALLELGNGVDLQGVKVTDDVGVEKNGVASHRELAVLVCCRSGSATISHQHSGMTAGHRIRVTGTGADITLTPDSLVLLVYSSGESRWLAYDLQRDATAAIAAALAVHVAAGDPHPQYTTAAEAAAAAPLQSINGLTGTPSLTAANVGADASGTAATAVANHVAASNPHTQYVRAARYSGTTSVSGTYSVTFSSAYSSTPNVQAELIGGTSNQFYKITSRSTTGFTVTTYTRNVVTVLGVDVVAGTPTVTNGLTVDVLVTSND